MQPTPDPAACPPLRAVIYDLDGTLVDSRADLADSVNAMLHRMGLPTRAEPEIRSFVGEGAERLIRRALGPPHEHRYPEAAALWWEEYGRRLLATTRPYTGVRELLGQAPDLRAVLTNKPGVLARKLLRGLGLDAAFRTVVGGDEAERKPAPEGLLRICRELGVQPAEALLVGDSHIDVATGRSAGVRVCAVAWGFGERSSLGGADHLADEPEQVAALLRALRAPA